jgi:hypothetical protein
MPISLPAHPGCSVAPFLPRRLHRAERRSTSLDESGPHRMITGVSAVAQCADIGRSGSRATTSKRPGAAERASAVSACLLAPILLRQSFDGIGMA